MKKIKVTNDISLIVYNADRKDDKIAQRAIFVVPHGADNSIFKFLSDNNHPRITAFYVGIVGVLKINKKGPYESSYGVSSQSIKFQDIHYNDEAERQVEGYLSLLRMTDKMAAGKPTSVIQVENMNEHPIEEFFHSALRAYKDAFVSENKKELENIMRMLKKDGKRFYSRLSPDGRKRRSTNETMTAYFLGDKEFIDALAEVTDYNKRNIILMDER